MRQLRLVQLSDDGTALVLDCAGSDEHFALPVDAVLRNAVRERPPRAAVTVPPGAATATATRAGTATGASIGPREIQMRVRAGESPQQLADCYGMSVESVLRFAAAVVNERHRIADEARRARARRTTTEGQVVVFGEAVDERFAAHGIAPADVSWDASRPDTEWIVVASWQGGADEHTAQWVFHRASRTVTPIDDAAIDLLSDRPIRPIAAPEPEPSGPPPLRPGVFVFPPMPDATTGPLPVIDDVFDQDAPPEGPRTFPGPPSRAERPAPAHLTSLAHDDLPAAPEPVGETAPTTSSPTTSSPTASSPTASNAPDFEEPPLPLGIVDLGIHDPARRTAGLLSPAGSRSRAGGHRRAESDEERAARARVPSWDDILLGVRRKPGTD